MNSIHNNGENDKSLDAELESLGSSYERLQQDEPPELLDQAILNSAHRAVEKKPHWMRFGWLQGLTTTAVFVLAFSLILNQQDSTPVPLDGVGETGIILQEREKEAKKQDREAESAQMRSKRAVRMNAAKELPAAAAPMTAGTANEPGDRARPVASDTQPSMDFMESRQEEVLSDEADLAASVMKLEVASETPQLKTLPAPMEQDADTQIDDAPGIEQALQAILALKQAGDDRWKTELESFKERYPDYPLPDALTDQVP